VMVREPRATGVSFNMDRALLVVSLEDGRELGVPLAWFPRLASASLEELSEWRLIGPGLGLHWERLDEDISVAGLLGLTTQTQSRVPAPAPA
jgi:hypothetical protein